MAKRKISDGSNETKVEQMQDITTLIKFFDGDVLGQFAELEEIIKRAYEESVTIPEAEKFAAQFLYAQMGAARVMRTVDLDARMKKSGLKAAVKTADTEIKSARARAYVDICAKYDKKPTETAIAGEIDMNEDFKALQSKHDDSVRKAQDALDRAETDRDAISVFLHVFSESHVFMRGISKGKYE